MAETNKSKMMSEAEIIEAINSDSLVSVSLGAGQPQKNVKISTLASVVAGIIGVKLSNKAYEYSEFIGGAIALEGTFTWSNGIAIIEGVNAANGFKYFKIAVASNSDYLTSNGIYLLESNGVVPDVYFRSDRIVIMNASSRFLFKVTSSVYATISSNVSIEGLNKKSF